MATIYHIHSLTRIPKNIAQKIDHAKQNHIKISNLDSKKKVADASNIIAPYLIGYENDLFLCETMNEKLGNLWILSHILAHQHCKIFSCNPITCIITPRWT